MDTKSLKPMWESLITRGVAGIVFGISAVFWPGLTLVVLVYVFSIYILVNGLVDMVESVMLLNRKQGWLWRMLMGIGQLGVGLYLVRHPLVSFQTFVLIVGLIMVVRGVFEAMIALLDDYSATNRMLLLIGAVISVVVGVTVLMQPVAGGLAFVWILGLYALVSGPISIALGLDLKRAAEASSTK